MGFIPITRAEPNKKHVIQWNTIPTMDKTEMHRFGLHPGSPVLVLSQSRDSVLLKTVKGSIALSGEIASQIKV